MDKNKPIDDQLILQEFDQKREQFEQQRYVSRFTESARFVRFGKAVKIKANIEQVWPILLENAMQSIHHDLKASDAKINGIYCAGKSQGKNYLHLSKFALDEGIKEIEIEFFQPNGWYRRNLKVIKRNDYCKIKYSETLKSLKEVFGLLSMIEKNVTLNNN